jgi:hypothetical protein
MYLKIHKSGSGIIVAVCDKDVLGKKLKHGNVNVVISEGFYKGDIASQEQVIEALANAKTANLFGDGAVDPECVVVIDGVQHAQIFHL